MDIRELHPLDVVVLVSTGNAGILRSKLMGRIDWFKDRYYFEGLKRDDRYAADRLGFKAPNIFIMELANF